MTKTYCHTCKKFLSNDPVNEKCTFGHSVWDPSLWKLFTWTTSNHRKYPKEFRQSVKVVLMMALVDKEGNPRHPEAYFYRLPKDLLKIIFQFLSKSVEFELNSSVIKQHVPDIRSIPPSKELIDHWFLRKERGE